MKLTLALVSLLSGSILFADVTVNSSNLKDLLEQKNSRIAAAKLQAEAANERKGYFARSFLPDIEIYGAQEDFKTGQHDRINQPAYGAEARLNLFNGGRDWAQADVREKRAEQLKFHSMRVQSEELEKSRIIYWEVLYLKEKIALQKSATEINERNFKAAVRRLNSGVGTESDRIEFEMHRIVLKQELEEANLQLNNRLRELAAILNLDDASEIKISETLEHEHDYKDLLQHKTKDHEFLYKESELLSNISELEARNKKYSWAPSIDAFATYNQYNQREIDLPDAGDRTESVVGLKAAIKFSSVFESNRESKALKQEALGLAKISEQQKYEIHVHVENEMSELDLLHSQVHLAEENIKLAEKYYKLTESEYSRGVKNSPDVLGASNRLLEIKDKQLQIVRDFQISKAHILSKIGK
ncbi:MAG: exporter outer rane component [Pseudobdellovibrio sp.]|jgi:outer membrane protein TolC|nr:exporter outer rane component [Pseudobdellovibrio sp.]